MLKKALISLAVLVAATVTFAAVGDIFSVGPADEFRVTSAGVATGNGSGLTSLSAANLTGNIAIARMTNGLADAIGADQLKDGDLGMVSVASGVVSVDAGVVTEAMLATAAQDKIAYLTMAFVDLTNAGTGTITIQLKDAGGNNLAARALVRTWIGTADDFGVDALTDYSVSTGTSKEEVTANGEYIAVTDTNGVIVMAIDNGGAATNYCWAEVGGRITASGAVVCTAP